MLKRLLLTLLIMVGCGNAHAGIPVFDAAQNVGRTLEFVETVIQWGLEIDEMRLQYDQMREEYRSMNGNRFWGNAARNNYEAYYDTWTETLNETDYAAVVNAARVVGIDEAAFDPDSPAALAMLNQQNSNALNRVLNENGFNRAQERLENLENLINRINSATDQKDIQDLQARIQAEQVMLQNEQARFTMMTSLQQNQRDMAEQQNRERMIQMSKPVKVVW